MNGAPSWLHEITNDAKDTTDMDDKYKLIALDLDGTLTNDQKEISKDTLKYIIGIQQAGLKIALASGRPTHGVSHIARQLKLDEFGGYMLSYNGGKIIRCSDGKILANHCLDLDLIPVLYQYAKDAGQSILTYTFDAVITEDADHELVKHESFLNGNMPIRKVTDFVEAVVKPPHKVAIIGEKEPLDKIFAELVQILGQRINIYRSAETYLEIVPAQIDKGKALSFLLSELNMTPKQLIAVGDSYNDLSMIQLAGLGVAMGNATEAVKQCAHYITKSNNEDGVAHLIQKVFFHAEDKKTIDLEYFNSLMQNTLMSTLGIKCTHLSEGRVEATMPVDIRTRQPMGILHGGATLAFAETLAGYGSVFLCDENEIQVGMQVSGNHISSAHEGDVVRGVATIVHKGRSSHVWNVDVLTGTDKIISSIRVVNSIIKRR